MVSAATWKIASEASTLRSSQKRRSLRLIRGLGALCALRIMQGSGFSQEYGSPFTTQY